MGRPAKFDLDQLLDAAIEIAARSGPAAVTMRAVAAAVGAPSGSVYHRFAGRPALLAAMWLHALDRFQGGYLAKFGEPDPLCAAAAAARHVIEWSADHPSYARVLARGAADFGIADWPAAQGEELAERNRRTADTIDTLAARLGATAPIDRDRVRAAVVDLPYALLRRHLPPAEDGAGELPRYLGELAAQSARALCAIDVTS